MLRRWECGAARSGPSGVGAGARSWELPRAPERSVGAPSSGEGAKKDQNRSWEGAGSRPEGLGAGRESGAESGGVWLSGAEGLGLAANENSVRGSALLLLPAL